MYVMGVLALAVPSYIYVSDEMDQIQSLAVLVNQPLCSYNKLIMLKFVMFY
jgi:hypothetical protein